MHPVDEQTINHKCGKQPIQNACEKVHFIMAICTECCIRKTIPTHEPSRKQLGCTKTYKVKKFNT